MGRHVRGHHDRSRRPTGATEGLFHHRVPGTGRAPHWDIRYDDGDEQIVDDFRVRVNARLMLLPPHDPQFRRNKERVNRDAERELIELVWDLGDDDFYGNR